MMFTFGICTTYDNIGQLTEVVDSIRALNIPNVEIVIAGSYEKFDRLIHQFPYHNVNTILSDGWLPKKKNTITKFASHENIVFLHDYYVFDHGWYNAYRKFGEAWDICSNPQHLISGHRHFTDWVVWDHPSLPRYTSLDYMDWAHTKYQYISGGYFLAKRSLLQQFPLNETMLPGSPEDVEWSLRVRDHAVIKCNPHAIVHHNKRHRDAGERGFRLEQAL